MMSARDLQIHKHLVIPSLELTEQVSTSGGPGGQHVNKTSTRVTLRWNVAQSQVLAPWQRSRLLEQLAARLTNTGDLLVHVDQTRSQHTNRAIARDRLAALVVKALERPKARRKTRPTRASQKRRVEGKKHRGVVKQLRKKIQKGDD